MRTQGIPTWACLFFVLAGVCAQRAGHEPVEAGGGGRAAVPVPAGGRLPRHAGGAQRPPRGPRNGHRAPAGGEPAGGARGLDQQVRVPLIAAMFNSRVPTLAASKPTTVAAYPGDSGAFNSRCP
eukprot:4284851-Pyramimonas_sp.AAC.1